jgi:hypothetical protein
MAYTHQVVTQYPETQTLGGTKTLDGMMVGYEIVVDQEFSVYLEVFIPQAVYNATQVKNYGIGYGGTIEGVFGVPGVVGQQWIQQVTAANQLQSAMIITVESDSGNSTGNFTIPFGKLDPKWVGPAAAKLIATLNDAEAG